MLRFSPLLSSRMVLQQEPARSAVFGDIIAGSGSSSDEPPRVTISIMQRHRDSGGGGRQAYSVEARLERLVDRVDHFRISHYKHPAGIWAWTAHLHPMPSGGDWSIRASAAGNVSAVLHHVAFGDVWMCAGQSNMEHALRDTFDRNQSMRAAMRGRYDNVRLLPSLQRDTFEPLEFAEWMPTRHAARNPAKYAPENGYGMWLHDEPSERYRGPFQPADWRMDEPALLAFCSVCWHFATALTDRFVSDGRPPPTIGLICAASGGASIERFFPPDRPARSQCANTLRENIEGPQKTLFGDAVPPNSPSLFRDYVAPLIGLTIKGWLWYQGEQNTQINGVSGNSAGRFGYGCELPALVRLWREMWSAVPNTTADDAPFGIVTLHPGGGMQGARDFGGMRWSQTANYGVVPNDALPNAFLAHAYDLPDPWMTNTSCSDWECCEVDLRGKPLRRKRPELSAALCSKRTRSLGGPEVCAPYCAALVDTPPGLLGSLHPRVKKPIGVRLAQAAYAQVYGGSNAVTGPTIAGCTLNKATRRLIIGFNKTLLRTEQLTWRKEAPPSFQVLTEPEAWCLQPMQRCPSQRDEQKEDVSCPWESREWWCPIELKGGGHYRTSQTVDPHGGLSGGLSRIVATRSADLYRLPRRHDVYESGWHYVTISSLDERAATIELDLSALPAGASVHAVRYAWGQSTATSGGEPLCCNRGTGHDALVGLKQPCKPAACELYASGGLPANPFVARIRRNGQCECLEPQVCVDK